MLRIVLRTSPVSVLVACLLTTGIFIWDVYAPVEMAVGMLYVAPVALIAMWSPPTHYSLVVLSAIVCTLLLVIGLFYVSPEFSMEMTIGNHALAVSAIWVTVILSLLRKRMEQKTRWVDIFFRR